MRGWLGGTADLVVAVRGSIGLRLRHANRALAVAVLGVLAVGLVGLGFAFVAALHGDPPDRGRDLAGSATSATEPRSGASGSATEPGADADETAAGDDTQESLDAPLTPDDEDATTPSSAADDRGTPESGSSPAAGATPATAGGQAARTTTTRPAAASTTTTLPAIPPTTAPPPAGGSGGLLGGLLDAVDKVL